ncbi:MAG: hypothetical protein ACI9R3_004784 [Verrucomicrobiales bacterium]|jgi:hypothetical protein
MHLKHLQNPPSALRAPFTSRIFSSICALATSAATAFALPTITEFSATGGVADAEGIDSDWIEVHNPDADAVSLAGYFLTDDAENLTKWAFPDVTLNAGAYLLVIASGQDLTAPASELHTSFRLSADGEYLGLVAPNGTTVVKQFGEMYPAQRDGISYGTGSIGTSTRETLIAPGADANWLVPIEEIADWNFAEFDDSGWTSGKTGIGFGYDELTGDGGNVETAMKGNNATVYIRVPFEIPQPEAVIAMTMRLKYEDGFVGYLNGMSIADDQAPGPDELAFNSSATSSRSDSLAEEYVTFEVLFSESLVAGTNVLGFQAMNSGRGGSDLILLPELVVEFRDLNAPIADGFFVNPTPGAPNSVGSSAPPEEVVFSLPAQTFTDTVTVTLSSPTANTVIRYTTDGSLPVQDINAPSEVYTEALTFDDTVQLRARAFLPGSIPGPTHSEGYIKLGEDFANFTSQLPILILDNFGRGTPSSDRMFYALLFEPKGPDMVADVRNLPDLATRSRAKTRGSSTGGDPKYNLSWEAWDERDEDKDIEPLGLPADSDWVLNSPFHFDRAMMRNPFMYEMSNQAGQWAPRSKMIEVFSNTDGEEVDNESTSRSDYFGVYALMEKVSRGRDRLDVSKIEQSDNEEPRVTGGYMWKVDRLDPGDRGIRGIRSASNSIGWIYPKEQVNRVRIITDQQEDYLVGYFNEMVVAMQADDFTNPDTGKHYTEYMDVQSWLNEHILRGLSKDPDAFRLSTYLNKPRGGKIHYGPIWDFDRTMGSEDGRDRNAVGWDGGSQWWTYPWWRELIWQPGRRRNNAGDPDFMQAYVDRYQDLRQNVMSVENMHAVVDGMAAEIGDEAAERHFARWTAVRPNGGQYDGDDGRTWKGEVTHLKGWLQTRVEWWDTEFAGRPTFSAPGGIVSDGFQLTMDSADGPVYYTLDGTDPRVSGGGISESAVLFPGGRVSTTLIDETEAVRYLVPTDGSLGDTWTTADFDDAAWTEAVTGIGFETNGGTLEAKITTNVSDAMRGVNASIYTRMEFTIDNDIENVNEATLRMQFDDGFVAWINGVQIASENAPDAIAWDSNATSGNSDADAIEYEDFAIENFKDLLVKGRNVLAVQGMNTSTSGSDMLIQPGLAINEIIVAQPLALNNSAVVTARTFTDELWSSPLVETYIVGGTVPASAANLVVSEVMYAPPVANVEEDAKRYNAEDFEFVEVMNISSSVVDLTNASFSSGVTFTFAGASVTSLLPGQRAVIVSNLDAFTLRYGRTLAQRVAGEFAEGSSLRALGEQLAIAGTGGAVIKDFEYTAVTPWPTATGSERFSIVLTNPGSNTDHTNGANWAKSTVPEGTPGTGESTGTGNPDADNDGDGLSAFLEYALGGDDNDASSGQGLIGVGALGSRAAFAYQKNLAADDVSFALETSTDLITWINADDRFDLVTETDNGDGTAQVSVLWKEAEVPDGEVYIRLRTNQTQ